MQVTITKFLKNIANETLKATTTIPKNIYNWLTALQKPPKLRWPYTRFMKMRGAEVSSKYANFRRDWPNFIDANELHEVQVHL